jgi:DNA polymerase III subunit epsilon
MDFVTIDFETANDNRASICAAGLAHVRNGEIVETKHWLIQPQNLYFDPINVSIHGITAEDVKDKPRFDQLWDEIRSCFADYVVLAHSASFDMSCLRYVLDSYGIEYPTLDYSQ